MAYSVIIPWNLQCWTMGYPTQCCQELSYQKKTILVDTYPTNRYPPMGYPWISYLFILPIVLLPWWVNSGFSGSLDKNLTTRKRVSPGQVPKIIEEISSLIGYPSYQRRFYIQSYLQNQWFSFDDLHLCQCSSNHFLNLRFPSRIRLSGHNYRMGPWFDSVQLPYKWLKSTVYGRYNMIQL